MKKSNNNIMTLQPKAILKMAEDLKEGIQIIKPDIRFKFSKYRRSQDYVILRKEIFKVTNINVSVQTLCDIVTDQHNGKMRSDIFNSITKFIEYVLAYSEMPNAQIILWGPDYGNPPGIFINSIEGKFIPWSKLKLEIESQVLSSCPRIIPIDSKIEVLSFYNKKNHVVKIFDNSANIIGDIWLGGNPEKNFHRDGLIRIGKAISDTKWIVYQIYERFSDNSYRLIKSNI